jgi:chitodextrinase
MSPRARTLAAASALFFLGACQDAVTPLDVAPAQAIVPGVSQIAATYAPVFVATAASASDLNDVGDVVGRRYLDTGCGSFCLPPQENFVVRNGARITLPVVPGFDVSMSNPLYLNNAGVIAGEAGILGTNVRAARWFPSGAGYTVQDLGTYPGTSSADVQGLDDQGRMVGWATQGGAIPTIALPFMWSPSTGMVNLAAQTYPNLRPAAMSPGGRVATASGTYQLGNPASVVPNAPLPSGFTGAGSNGTVINDNGDQGHMLISISTQNLAYPFRLSRGGSWQQLSSAGSGNLSRWGMGGINDAQDIVFTVLSTGMFADGPAGLGQSLGGRISSAYPGATVSTVGNLNAGGEILASLLLGRSSRVVKLTPVGPCLTNCIVVASLTMVGQFIQDPNNPGSCFQGGSMYNRTTATMRLTNESGAVLGNAQVRGRFLDDYWTDAQVTGTTDSAGTLSFVHTGLCGVGAIAFFVDGVTAGTRSLDRTRGTLTNWVIPTAAPPTNQPPVASFRFSCNASTRLCRFNGTGSTDDVGVTSWQWAFGDGTSGSGATVSHTYASPGTYQVTLTVRDSAGLSNSLTRSVVVGNATNQPPVAAWSVSCQPPPAHTCTFDGSASTDPDGTIVGYKWTNGAGTVLSTLPVFTRTFVRSATLSLTLTVTDNGGFSNSLTQTVTVP